MLITGPHADRQLTDLTDRAIDHINEVLFPVLSLPIGEEWQQDPHPAIIVYGLIRMLSGGLQAWSLPPTAFNQALLSILMTIDAGPTKKV